MMNNRANVALLLGVIATALRDPTEAEAFAPSPSSPLLGRTCAGRGASTEAGLFRRRRRSRPDPNADGDGDGASPRQDDRENSSDQPSNSRRLFIAGAAAAASLPPRRASADEKRLNLSNNDLKQIVMSDMVDRSFLVSADITRSIYDESATFTDEIDSYTMDKWIKGTKALFVASGSRVSLVGDVDVSPAEVSFRFDEDLMFNIPFKPVCSLTGKVVLTRHERTGLITSYREYWDQSVNEVLKTAKFGKKASQSA